MEYVKSPNLPQEDVTRVLVDGRAGPEIIWTLEHLGIRPVKTRLHSDVYAAISGHADIMVFHMGGNRMVYAPGTDAGVLKELEGLGFQLFRGSTPLTGTYPGDIAYNVACIGKYAFHNTHYTDPVIREMLEQEEIELVHVNQGYTKCATAVAGQGAVLTADSGIGKAAEKCGMNVLLLDPDQGIRLPGVNNGFIGGASGMLGRHKWAIAGDLDSLRSADAIRRFLQDQGIEVVSLGTGPVVDLGSILPLQCREEGQPASTEWDTPSR